MYVVPSAFEYFKGYLSGEVVIRQRNAAHGSIAENVCRFQGQYHIDWYILSIDE